MKTKQKALLFASLVAAVSLLLCSVCPSAVAADRPRDLSPSKDKSTLTYETGPNNPGNASDSAGLAPPGGAPAPQGLLGRIWNNMTLKNVYTVAVKGGASYLGYYMSAIYPPIGITILTINGLHSIYIISKGVYNNTDASSPKGDTGVVRPSDAGRPVVPPGGGFVYKDQGQTERTLNRNLPGEDSMSGSDYSDEGERIKDYDWSEVERMRQDLDRDSAGAGKEMEDYKRSIGLD